MSLPSRGAWIEIPAAGRPWQLPAVAPLAGSVDRNFRAEIAHIHHLDVAPLAGSVDRNNAARGQKRKKSKVAPLAGSVDRNYPSHPSACFARWSLPSRGAWIEISLRLNGNTVDSCRSPRGERG